MMLGVSEKGSFPVTESLIDSRHISVDANVKRHYIICTQTFLFQTVRWSSESSLFFKYKGVNIDQK